MATTPASRERNQFILWQYLVASILRHGSRAVDRTNPSPNPTGIAFGFMVAWTPPWHCEIVTRAIVFVIHFNAELSQTTALAFRRVGWVTCPRRFPSFRLCCSSPRNPTQSPSRPYDRSAWRTVVDIQQSKVLVDTTVLRQLRHFYKTTASSFRGAVCEQCQPVYCMIQAATSR
jgi:hypothetical protein